MKPDPDDVPRMSAARIVAEWAPAPRRTVRSRAVRNELISCGLAVLVFGLFVLLGVLL